MRLRPVLLVAVLLAAVVGAAALLPDDPAPAPVCPGPDCPNNPQPAPAPILPPAPPKPRPGPWGPRFLPPVGGYALAASIEASVGGETGPDGTEISCPLPGDFHTKNVGGSDGAGLCVFCSMHHSGVWAGEPVFAGIFDWMKRHPGGGYPDKVTKMVEQCAREKGLPVPDYIQVEGKDLEVLRAACKGGRMPGVTYSVSPTGRYGGSKIAHMVSLVHADDKHFVILDNNYPGVDKYEWLSPAEFLRSYAMGGNGWAVIPLKPGPPLPPHNPKE